MALQACYLPESHSSDNRWRSLCQSQVEEVSRFSKGGLEHREAVYFGVVDTKLDTCCCLHRNTPLIIPDAWSTTI